MLNRANVMADEVGECNVNYADPFKNAFSVNDVKEEECQDEDSADDKVHISETAIFIENVKLQDHSIHDKMEQYNISTTLDNVKPELALAEVQYDTIHENFKIEEGISTDDVKIESSNRLLYCEKCHAYYEDFCTKCGMLLHILNRTVSANADNRTREELPYNILEIQDRFGLIRIIALKDIPVGVKFGPFTGLNKNEHPWIIKGGKFVVNEDKSMYLNWMRHINPARNPYEQNLLLFQYDGNLYYQTTREIQEGDELLVDFGVEYEESLNKNVEMDFVPPIDHNFRDAFACTFCCLGFSSKSYLARHKTICPANAAGRFSIEELTQCPTCRIHLGQKEYIMHHMACCYERNDRKLILPTAAHQVTQVSGRKARQHQMYKCQQCKYRTKYKGALNTHTNQHYEVKTYKCAICSRRFKTKEALRVHVENTQMCAGGKKDPEHVKGYKQNCDTFDYKSNRKDLLKPHIKTRHSKEFKYKCELCVHKTNRKFDLMKHIERRHLKEFKYKCDTCDYKAILRSQLMRHTMTWHLKAFNYNCETCDYRTNWKPNLKKHIDTRHLNAFKYNCGACDYKTNWQSSLKNHTEARHLKEFQYKCDRCDYKTNRKDNLKTHIEISHLKEFKYKCDTCDYKANHKSNLNRHVEAKHSSEFKHKCERCGYETNRKSNLKAHMETKHLNVFNYKCDMCDYKANQKSNLNRHVKTRHLGEFKHKCDTPLTLCET